MARVTFTVGKEVVVSEWRDTATARQLLAALPLTARGSYWGGELYFPVPLKASPEADAADVVEPGTVAFWTEGSCLCLFWGPTPASRGNECRAAGLVNIVGRVTNPEVLARLNGSQVTVAIGE